MGAAALCPRSPLVLSEPLLGRGHESNCTSRALGVAYSVMGGGLAGLLMFFRALSFAAAYAQALPDPHAAFGLMFKSFLLGTVLSQVLYGSQHRVGWTVAGPSSTAVPLNVRLISLAAVGVTSPDEAALCGLIVIAMVSASSATFFLFVQRLAGKKLDAILKACLPQPALFGLFACIGWALVATGVNLVRGHGSIFEFAPEVACALLSGAGARIIMRSERFKKIPATLPAILFLQLVLFWIIVGVVRRAGVEPNLQGRWLFQAAEQYPISAYARTWCRAFVPNEWLSGQLSSVLRVSVWIKVMNTIPMIMLDLISIIIPIERAAMRSLSMQSELRLAATSCLLAASVGSGPSYVVLSPSRVCLESGGAFGGSRRLGYVTSFTAMLVPLLALTPVGSVLVSVCPKFLIAGMLVNLGLGYFMEGVWDSRELFMAHAPLEYLVVAIIFAIYFGMGFMQAMTVGLMLLTLMFVFRYGGGDVVEFACSGASVQMQSQLYRSPEEREALQHRLQRLFMVRTNCSQLFFGSIGALLSAAAPVLNDEVGSDGATRFLILDINTVQHIDVSALVTLKSHSTKRLVIVIVGQPKLVKSLRESSTLGTLRFFDSVDLAIEFCEEQLLLELGGFGLAGQVKQPRLCADERHRRRLVDTQLAAPLSSAQAISILSASLVGASPELLLTLLHDRFSERVRLTRGAVVHQEGTACKGMLICLHGHLALYSGEVWLAHIHSEIGLDPLVKQRWGPEEPGSTLHNHRVKTLKPGDVVGEAALLSLRPTLNSGTLVADTESEVLLIRRETMLVLEKNHLSNALELHRSITRRIIACHPELSGVRLNLELPSWEIAAREHRELERLHMVP